MRGEDEWNQERGVKSASRENEERRRKNKRGTCGSYRLMMRKSRRSRKWQGRERKREGMMMVQTRGMNSMPPAVDIKRGGERRRETRRDAKQIRASLSFQSTRF